MYAHHSRHDVLYVLHSIHCRKHNHNSQSSLCNVPYEMVQHSSYKINTQRLGVTCLLGYLLIFIIEKMNFKDCILCCCWLVNQSIRTFPKRIICRIGFVLFSNNGFAHAQPYSTNRVCDDYHIYLILDCSIGTPMLFFAHRLFYSIEYRKLSIELTMWHYAAWIKRRIKLRWFWVIPLEWRIKLFGASVGIIEWAQIYSVIAVFEPTSTRLTNKWMAC